MEDLVIDTPANYLYSANRENPCNNLRIFLIDHCGSQGCR